MIDLTNISEVKKILEKHGLKAKKSFSQNFLINKNVLERIVESAHIKEDETIVEIGCGLGVLTQELAKNMITVLVYEKDRQMIEIAKENLRDFKNIIFVEGDVLEQPRLKMPHKLVANIPYSITSLILKHFLMPPEGSRRPESMTILIQKEVAEKICANPPKMNLLAILVQTFGKPKIIQTVPKSAFFPAPKVDSAILKIDTFTLPLIPQHLLDKFFEIVREVFTKKRKILSQTLAQILKVEKSEVEKILTKVGVKPSSRPENLSIKDWLSIIEKI